MTPKKPMPDSMAIGTAVEWLRNNEGDESPLCEAVADWLDHMDYEREIRRAAREGGVTVMQLRRKLREESGQ